MKTAYETFDTLGQWPEFVHAFTLREPAIAVDVDREAALQRLASPHLEVVEALGYTESSWVRAQQVHGDGIAVVDRHHGGQILPEVDGLISNDPSVLLGIYVADCGAIYLMDPVKGAFGLLHSGRKGSELGIVRKAIEMMGQHFGSKPEDLVVQLGPCIRPPHYEIDFAKLIREDVLSAGVKAENYHDLGTCTAANSDRYYTYRLEKGKTGRMVALLGRKSQAAA